MLNSVRFGTLWLLGCLLLSSGCGFQLRGTTSLPENLQPLYLRADSSLRTELLNALQAADIEISTSLQAANSVLVVESDSDKRMLSLAEDARVAEYQLLETVTVSLQDRKQQTLYGPITVRDRSVLENDPDKVVSTDREQQLLLDEMRRSLADKVVRQLSLLSTTRPDNANQ